MIEALYGTTTPASVRTRSGATMEASGGTGASAASRNCGAGAKRSARSRSPSRSTPPTAPSGSCTHCPAPDPGARRCAGAATPATTRRGVRPPVGAGDARLRERKGHHVPLESGRGRARGGASDGAGDRAANRPGAVARGRRRAGARTVVAHKDEVAGPANGSAQKKPAVRNAPTSTLCTASPTAAGLFAATRQIANEGAPMSVGPSGEIMLRVLCVLDVEETGIPALELRPERVIEHPGWRRI